MTDQNKKTLRQFQCRDYLWEIFEQMSGELECSVDYLINEAMRQYARSRNYGARSGVGDPSGQRIAPSVPSGAPTPSAAAAPRVPSQPSIPSAPPPPPARPAAPVGYPPPPRPAPGAYPSAPAPHPSYATGSPEPGYGAQVGYRVPPPYPSPSSPAGYPSPSSPAGYPAPPPARPAPASSYPPPSPTQRPPALQGGGGGGGFGYAPAPPPLPGAAAARTTSTGEPRPPLFVIFNGQRYPVNKDEFIIGRGSKSADLAIKDGNISRRHAAVIYQNGAYYIKDLGSTNGVEFQGRKVDGKRIEEGDVFHLCDYELRFTYR
jgi:hypothetical protein